MLLLIADQFTKTLILGYYRLGDATYVTSFFNIVRPQHGRSLRSWPAQAAGTWLFTGIGVVAAAFIVWQLRQLRVSGSSAFRSRASWEAPSATSWTGCSTAMWSTFWTFT